MMGLRKTTPMKERSFETLSLEFFVVGLENVIFRRRVLAELKISLLAN
jgi:hypothetical protein